MLLNSVNPQSHMNRLDSFGETGFGKDFSLAIMMSKGLHRSSVDIQK